MEKVWPLPPRNLRGRESSKNYCVYFKCWPFISTTHSTFVTPLRWMLFLPLFYDKERGSIICLRSHCYCVRNQEWGPKPRVSPLYTVDTTSRDLGILPLSPRQLQNLEENVLISLNLCFVIYKIWKIVFTSQGYVWSMYAMFLAHNSSPCSLSLVS